MNGEESMRAFPIVAAILMLAACRQSEPPPEPEPAPVDAAPVVRSEPEPTSAAEAPASGERDRLAEILDAQPEQVQQRYDERHPHATLEFFGIEPGMTVVETLPGGGWYTRILLPYLGADGGLIAANYAQAMFANFGFADEQFMVRLARWPEEFPTRTAGWCQGDCAPVETFWLGSLPARLEGSADAMLFVRALHNLARFETEDGGSYLDEALADAYAVLAPGGILGIVQHEARPDMPDDWADGNNGYLKKQFVIDRVRQAGFELVAESDINANPDDVPTTEESVWRLPPSLSVPEDAEDPEALRDRYRAIGESNRMTLKFRKPEAPAG
jgi:predicted methyltransferase